MTTPPGVRAKVEKAKADAEGLSDWITDSLYGRVDHPYRLVPEFDLEAGKCRFRVEQVEEPPLIEWGVEVGGIVHGLRSALDDLAYQLALRNAPNHDPPPGTEFPIFLDPERYARKGRGGGLYKVRGPASGDQAAIQALQPFDTPTAPLWVLQQLSNTDKHRLTLTIDTKLGLPMTTGPTWRHLRVTGEKWELGWYEDNAVIATFCFTQTGPNPKVEVGFNPTVGVLINEGVERPSEVPRAGAPRVA